MDKNTSVNKQLQAIQDVKVTVSAVLGTAQIQISQLLKMGRGGVITLDKKVGEPIDILVNNRLVARGELTIDGDDMGVTLTEIVKR